MTMSMNETGASQKKTFLEFDKCTPLDDVTPWCYTRVDENGTYILGIYFWHIRIFKEICTHDIRSVGLLLRAVHWREARLRV